MVSTKSLVLGLIVSLCSTFYTPPLYSSDSESNRSKSKLESLVQEENTSSHSQMSDLEFIRHVNLDKIEEMRSSIQYIEFSKIDGLKRVKTPINLHTLDEMIELHDRMYRTSDFEHNVKLNDGIYDAKKFKEIITQTSRKLGYKGHADWDTRGYLRWESSLVRYWVKYMKPIDKRIDAVDTAYLDQLIINSKGERNAVDIICRNYATLLQNVHRITKDGNERTKDIRCMRVRNNNHMWNLYFIPTQDGKIYATSVDATWDDDKKDTHTKYTKMDWTGGTHYEWLRKSDYTYECAGEILFTHHYLEDAIRLYNDKLRHKNDRDFSKRLYIDLIMEYINDHYKEELIKIKK